MSVGRMSAAVPFVGKDAPSFMSEFAHPDVVIGLTALAMWYVATVALPASVAATADRWDCISCVEAGTVACESATSSGWWVCYVSSWSPMVTNHNVRRSTSCSSSGPKRRRWLGQLHHKRHHLRFVHIATPGCCCAFVATYNYMLSSPPGT